MKRLLSVISVALVLLVMTVPVSAVDGESKTFEDELKQLEQIGTIKYEDDEITVWDLGNDEEISDSILNHPDSVVSNVDSEITPFSSATGPGGYASIYAGDSGRIVYWTVRPATAWPYHFEGLVKLRYHSGFRRDAVIGGMGALGSTLNGAVTMNKNNGGVAYLTGTAYSLNFKKYRVLPGVQTSFRAN
ncbi:MAG: hypothetical protein ACTHW2_12855 [Tissierella sp.]|uniref:hypothetical protein n=1 Tax=Tissierella sp. TaxID=41274 RepID=UPI003F9646D0